MGLTTSENPSFERERIRQALLDLCFERCYRNIDLDDLCARAAVDRPAFDRHYDDLEDCFCQVYEAELDDFLRRAELARRSEPVWRDRLRAVAYTLFRVLSADQKVTNLVIVEVRTAGERANRALGGGIEWLIDLVDEGREEAADPASVSRATAESVAGGIFSQLFTAVGRHGPLPTEAKIVPQLMYSAVLPYLGVEAAEEELSIPPPPLANPAAERLLIHDALIDVACERGYKQVTIAAVLERSGVDRAAFDGLYSSLDDCYEQVFELEQRRILGFLAQARAGLPTWRDRLRATAYAIFRYFSRDPRITRFIVYETRAANERVQVMWLQGFESLFDLIDEGREEMADPEALSRATAESIAGGIFNQLFSALTRGPLADEREIIPKLMYTSVLPYVGVQAAMEELSIPPPPREAF